MGWERFFKLRPRDAAVGGIPLTNTDQLFLFWRNRTTQSTGVTVRATVYDPATNKTRTFPAVGPLSSTGTTFTNETTTGSEVGLFNDGEILVAVMVTTGQITDPTQLWVAVELFRGGNSVAWLCEGYCHGGSHVPSWQTGASNFSQLSLANPATDGALYTFQGEVVNGAGGAGVQSLTVAPATGGRFRVLGLISVNGDTAAVNHSAHIYNGASTNAVDIIRPLLTASSVAAAGAIAWPGFGGSTVIAHGDGPSAWVAGANRLVILTGSVAASENTNFGVVLEVWGAAPTFTLAGASTPTLTVNISRFEPG